MSDPEEASGTDSGIPILDRLLGNEGKVYNIYTSDRKFLNLLRNFDSEYEDAENSVSGNEAVSGNRSDSDDRLISGNEAVSDNRMVSGNEAVSDNQSASEKTVSSNSVEPEYGKSGEVIETGKIGDVTVRWHIVENDPDKYESVLDKALVNQDSSADEKVDLFLIDGDSVAKYCDATANVTKTLSQVGLNEADLAQQYTFTRTIGSDENKAQRAITWEVPCGIFAYRRSAARKTLGTDDPSEVQKKVKDWDAFRNTASLISSKGYRMLSGFTDAYYVYLEQRKAGWVDDQDQLSVDPEMAAWVHTTKSFTDSGYNNRRIGFHGKEWQEDIRQDQNLFGTFMTASDISDYLIGDQMSNGSVSANALPSETVSGNTVSDNSTPGGEGDWAVCPGPSAYSQGGQWICVSQNTDNLTLSRDLLRRVICAEDVMTQITRTTGEMTNHMSAMKKISGENGFGSSLFGAQNYIEVYDDAAKSCRAGKRTLYDREINEAFMNAFIPYFSGSADEGKALNLFYTEVMNQYPDLSY